MPQRVNKVTVYVEDELAAITLACNNRKSVELSADDLGLPLFTNSKCPNKQVYQNYCRDFTVHLLEQGGIVGYYWEAKKSDAMPVGTMRKYDVSSFISAGRQRVELILGGLEMDIPFDIDCDQSDVTIRERYKDKMLQSATAHFKVVAHRKLWPKASDPDVILTIPVEIKSGQLCRPKEFSTIHGNYPINRTKMRSIISTF